MQKSSHGTYIYGQVNKNSLTQARPELYLEQIVKDGQSTLPL